MGFFLKYHVAASLLRDLLPREIADLFNLQTSQISPPLLNQRSVRRITFLFLSNGALLPSYPRQVSASAGEVKVCFVAIRKTFNYFLTRKKAAESAYGAAVRSLPQNQPFGEPPVLKWSCTSHFFFF
jgi:hypothetical protein